MIFQIKIHINKIRHRKYFQLHYKCHDYYIYFMGHRILQQKWWNVMLEQIYFLWTSDDGNIFFFLIRILKWLHSVLEINFLMFFPKL